MDFAREGYRLGSGADQAPRARRSFSSDPPGSKPMQYRTGKIRGDEADLWLRENDAHYDRGPKRRRY